MIKNKKVIIIVVVVLFSAFITFIGCSLIYRNQINSNVERETVSKTDTTEKIVNVTKNVTEEISTETNTQSRLINTIDEKELSKILSCFRDGFDRDTSSEEDIESFVYMYLCNNNFDKWNVYEKLSKEEKEDFEGDNEYESALYLNVEEIMDVWNTVLDTSIQEVCKEKSNNSINERGGNKI